MKTRYLLTALLAFLLQSCTPEAIRVSSITLNTKSLDLEVGMTEVLIATVSPSDAANLKVIWFSDNSSVAKYRLTEA